MSYPPLFIFRNMNIVAIETSTTVCSAALFVDGQCVKSLVDTSGQNHARQLPLFVSQLLDESRAMNLHIDAVALSQGPGSYTGLRIGTALAKGLCYGHNIPLIAIDTLQLMAFSASRKIVIEPEVLLCPMIDARRMEVYTALYDNNLQPVTQVEAKIIGADSFADILAKRKVYFFGNGADKCKGILTVHNAVFIDGITPLAEDMSFLAKKLYDAREFADVAYFDPFYLKEFQATVAKNKVF